MTRHFSRSAAILCGLALVLGRIAPASAADLTVAEMQGHRRVLLVSSPNETDSGFQDQRRVLAAWAGGEERDVTIVQIAGDHVKGSSDSAAALRRRYEIPPQRFMAVLLGKDGHVALRSETPISAEMLGQTIDAMPMRKAGER